MIANRKIRVSGRLRHRLPNGKSRVSDEVIKIVRTIVIKYYLNKQLLFVNFRLVVSVFGSN